MSRKWIVVAAVALCVPAAWWLAQRMGSRIVTVTPPTEGISRTLASERAANISSVRYALSLSIPSKKDRAGARHRVGSAGPRRSRAADFRLRAAGGEGLVNPGQRPGGRRPLRARASRRSRRVAEARREHRRDRLHGRRRGAEPQRRVSLLAVRARARLAGLPLFRPARHQGLALADARDSRRLGRRVSTRRRSAARRQATARPCGSARRRRFPPTCSDSRPDNFRSSAASAAAARSTCTTARPTPEKVAANRETIFDLHQQAIDWLETYTDRKYPFQKLDFVLLPAFQFGGMEHAGAIFYNAP